MNEQGSGTSGADLNQAARTCFKVLKYQKLIDTDRYGCYKSGGTATTSWAESLLSYDI